MNIQPFEALAEARMRDIRREVAQCRPGPQPESQPSHEQRVPRRLRNRIGFTLVEAGLHLMATPVPRD